MVDTSAAGFWMENNAISDPVVDNFNAAYSISVETSGTWSTAGADLEIVRAWVEYEVTEVD